MTVTTTTTKRKSTEHSPTKKTQGRNRMPNLVTSLKGSSAGNVAGLGSAKEEVYWVLDFVLVFLLLLETLGLMLLRSQKKMLYR